MHPGGGGADNGLGLPNEVPDGHGIGQLQTTTYSAPVSLPDRCLSVFAFSNIYFCFHLYCFVFLLRFGYTNRSLQVWRSGLTVLGGLMHGILSCTLYMFIAGVWISKESLLDQSCRFYMSS